MYNSSGNPRLEPAVSIVVPTYNERGRLAELVGAIFAVLGGHHVDGEVVIVDDNSPDGTGDLAESLAATHPIRVIHRAGKLGLGTAVIEGFAAARSAVLAVMDADLSHPPDLVPAMLSILDKTGADLVVASRYISGGGTRNWPFVRLLMSRFACALARPITPVRDATSGFFLIRREVANGVRISAGGFKICLELLMRSRPHLIVEVPYVFSNRTAGASKMSLREAVGYFRQLRDLYRYRWFSNAGPRPRYRSIPFAEMTAATVPDSAKRTSVAP